MTRSNPPHSSPKLSNEHFATLPLPVMIEFISFLNRWDEYELALSYLRAIPELIPKHPSLNLQQIEALFGTKQDDLAHEQIEDTELKNVRIFSLLCDAYITQKEWTKAEQSALSITEHFPEETIGWTHLGDVYRHTSQWERAEESYQTHQQKEPNSRQPLLGLMWLYVSTHQPVTAQAHAVRALTEKPNDQEFQSRELRDLLFFFEQQGQKHYAKETKKKLSELQKKENALIEKQLKSAIHNQRKNPTREPKQATETLSKNIKEDLQTYFGYTSLRQGQKEVIQAVYGGHDVIAVMPTGAGKSLCYLLPTLTMPGVTLVISPLVSLMEDQVSHLPTELQDKTIAIHGQLSEDHVWEAMQGINEQKYKLVFVAPERLRQRAFRYALRQNDLRRLVIDEAHCISMWGHDFRPDYAQIGALQKSLGMPQKLLFTATAPERVLSDLQKQLFPNKKPRLIQTDPFRSNLNLEIHRLDNDTQKNEIIAHLCTTIEGSGIIYVPSRHRCDGLASKLTGLGIEVESYHAGKDDRAKIQARFMRSSSSLLVATIAFGMGINKPNLRFVIHDGLPSTLADYAQQIGRAGRDGETSRCVLLYTERDMYNHFHRPSGDIDLESLRALYRVIRQSAPDSQYTFLKKKETSQALKITPQTLRISIHILEQTGLIKRRADTPQFAFVQRLEHFHRASDLARPASQLFENFIHSSQIPYRGAKNIGLQRVAYLLKIPLQQLEWHLLNWENEGRLVYEPYQKSILIEQLPTPDDVPKRIQIQLQQRLQAQESHNSALADYILAKTCRHGMLGQYLGGKSRENCGVCDNCSPERVSHLKDQPVRPIQRQ